VDVVVELVGGYEPARTIVLAALKAGKHVATANKALLSKHWGEVFTTAQKAGALVYFEAAVGGGIPIIQVLNEGLAANRVERFYGILVEHYVSVSNLRAIETRHEVKFRGLCQLHRMHLFKEGSQVRRFIQYPLVCYLCQAHWFMVELKRV
jgi:hypothetical protein